MAETLCDWKKNEIRDRKQELFTIAREPKFFLPEMCASVQCGEGFVQADEV